MTDAINPNHYTQHPSGVECIQITEHMSFTLGNAIKYIWRADLKNGIEDLKKAMWYIDREVVRRESNMPYNSYEKREPLISPYSAEKECNNCCNHGPISSALCHDCIRGGGTFDHWEAKA